MQRVTYTAIEGFMDSELEAGERPSPTNENDVFPTTTTKAIQVYPMLCSL